MTNTLKVLLLSSLVYPGAGHYFLQKYKSCWVFAGVFSIFLILLISELTVKSNEIVDKLTNGNIPLNVDAVLDAAIAAVSDSMSFTFYMMMFLWFVAIVDSIRLSLKLPSSA